MSASKAGPIRAGMVPGTKPPGREARAAFARALTPAAMAAVLLAAITVAAVPAQAAERRQSGTSADRAPSRGSSAQLGGGSSADRYGGSSADHAGVGGNRDDRLESTRGKKSYGKPDADRKERMERRQRQAAENGEALGTDEGSGN